MVEHEIEVCGGVQVKGGIVLVVLLLAGVVGALRVKDTLVYILDLLFAQTVDLCPQAVVFDLGDVEGE